MRNIVKKRTGAGAGSKNARRGRGRRRPRNFVPGEKASETRPSPLLSLARLHRPLGFDQAFVTAEERKDVSIAHFLRDGSRENGAVATATIHDDLAIGVGDHLLQIALQNAFAEMDGFLGMAF